MTKLAIIADDLTGALDSAAPFAARGLRTVVALSPAALPDALATDAAIVAVSTDSRDVAADLARERVAAALGHLPDGVALFKKIDSRLKGNLAAELDAFDFESALVVPAIPAFGRFIREGLLTGFGIDTPIDIAEKLGIHAGKAHVPDVSSQADIDAALATRSTDLPVGARGLAEALALLLAPRSSPATPDLRFRRAIFIVGSRDPITQVQIEWLRSMRPDLAYVEAPDGVPSARVAPANALAVLHATPGSGDSTPDTVARRLADALDDAGPLDDALLVVSGGATAQIVLEHLGIATVEVLGEALPGLPIARAGGFKLITKSGGFGNPDALVEILATGTQRAAAGIT